MADVHRTVSPEQAGLRLDVVLAASGSLSRSAWQKHIRAGRVAVNGRTVERSSEPVAAADMIEARLPQPQPQVQADATVSPEILYETPDWAAVNKPVDLLVHPGAGQSVPTLAHGMMARYPELAMEPFSDPVRPGVVHRLDAPTSGVLLWARRESAQRKLMDMFARRAVVKVYLAWVRGEVRESATIDRPIRRSQNDPTRFTSRVHGRMEAGRTARTSYWPISIRPAAPGFELGLSLLAVQIHTGRTHQIRVHLADEQHPVVGDSTYNPQRKLENAPRMMLHAWRLRFADPCDGGNPVELEAPLPAHFGIARAELKHLDLWSEQIWPQLGQDDAVSGTDTDAEDEDDVAVSD